MFVYILQCQGSRVPSFDHQIGQCRRDRSSRRHRESRAGGPSHQTWWGGVWHRTARRQDRCVSARLSHHCRARPRQRGNTHNTQTQTEACTKKKTRTQTQIERETRTTCTVSTNLRFWPWSTGEIAPLLLAMLWKPTRPSQCTRNQKKTALFFS